MTRLPVQGSIAIALVAAMVASTLTMPPVQAAAPAALEPAEIVELCVSDAPNVIRGTSGDDVLRGTAGDDVICGFGGNDALAGRG